MHARGISLCREAMGGQFQLGSLVFWGTEMPNELGDRGGVRGMAPGPEYDFTVVADVSAFSGSSLPVFGQTLVHVDSGKRLAIVAVDTTPLSFEVMIRVRNPRQ